MPAAAGVPKVADGSGTAEDEWLAVGDASAREAAGAAQEAATVGGQVVVMRSARRAVMVCRRAHEHDEEQREHRSQVMPRGRPHAYQ